MKTLLHYIDGAFVRPVTDMGRFPVFNPATEEQVAEIAMGSADDANLAVAAAHRAFQTYSLTTLDERIALMEKLLDDEILAARICPLI